MKKPLVLGAVAVIPIAALVNVAEAHHARLVLSHYFGGRAGNCSVIEAFQGENLSRLQAANVEAIRAGSHIVRKDGHYTQWSTPDGEYWLPGGSFEGAIYDLGEQKRNIYGTHIHRGDIVLDAGANIGVFTRKALSSGAAKVIAIEPGPENIECLRRTFAAEIASGKVVVYPKGIWDKDDVLKFKIDPVDSAKDSFVRDVENADYVEAPLTTVDKLVAELHLPRVDFIKMDIEGAEQRAVVGARQTIGRFHPRMSLCIYHVKGDEVQVPKLVRDADPSYQVHKTCFCGKDQILPEVAFFD
jgi:FkbM family methyltransferase